MHEISEGINHHESGRLAEAEAIYRKILGKDPNHSDALHWLGVIAHQMGNNEAALELIAKAISINHTDAKYYSHLGMAYKGLKRFDEAIISFQKAIIMDPGIAQAYNNLGNVYQVQCRFDDAIEYYHKALNINSSLVEAIKNIGDIYRKRGEPSLALALYQKIKSIAPDTFTAHDAALSSAILHYLNNDLETARKELIFANGMFGGISRASIDSQTYCHYLEFLLTWWATAGNQSKQPIENEPLYVIGESHSLSLQNIVVSIDDKKQLRCQAKWIEGCKQWHLANAENNIYKYQVSQVFSLLPVNSIILLAIGEIDCRHNEGIFPLWKIKKRDLQDIINTTVSGYLDFVQALATSRNIRLIIIGVPASNASLGDLSGGDAAQFGWFIGIFNEFLRKSALGRGMEFLDVFTLTNAGGGFADGAWHLDSHHLRPDSMRTAFLEHLIKPKESDATFNTKEQLMPTIKIDEIEYDLDSLSAEAKSQLQMLQVTEQEIQRLQLQLMIVQTARNAYANALKSALPTQLEMVQAKGDTLKIS